MSENKRIPLIEAEILAKQIVDRLRPHCQRIQIAGSIRRRKPDVGDIEIVAIPEFINDMFGNQSSEHELDMIDWTDFGKVCKNGSKYKQVELWEGVNLDLFIVTPPAQWGVQFIIRTGPADFSHKFVTPKKFGGMLPSNLTVKNGAIWNGNKIIPTPEEEDDFDLLGIGFIVPENRQP